MKKLISIILTAVLLCLSLAACAGKEVESTEATKPDGKYFYLNSLPDIGKYSSGDVKNYFYKSGALRKFEASPDYRYIIPYACGRGAYESVEFGESFDHNYFGIATYDGKIITDAIYSRAYPYTFDNGKTVFVFSKKSTDTETRQADIITQDGRILIESRVNADSYNDIHFYDNMPCRCMSVPTTEGTVLYDSSGKLIMNLTEAFGADCYFYIHYCDGEKVIFSVSTEEYGDFYKPDIDFYCANKNGDLIYTLSFGEFYPISFDGGLFTLSDDNGKRRLANVMGDIVTGKTKYDEIIYDKTEGCFWCLDKDNSLFKKLDRSGDELMRKTVGFVEPNCYLMTSSEGSSLFIYESSERRNFRWFSSKTGDEYSLVDTDSITDICFAFDEKNDYLQVCYSDSVDFYNTAATYLKTMKNPAEINGIYNGKVLYRDKENRLCISGLRANQSFKLPLSDKLTDYAISSFDEKTLSVFYMLDETSYMNVYDIETGDTLIEGLENGDYIDTAYGKIYSGRLNNKFIVADESGKILISITDKFLL